MTQPCLRAFDGSEAVRTGAVERLKAHRAAGQLTVGALFWNGTQGSIAASLIDSGDPADWQARLGLAPWLAYALDAVIAAPVNDAAIEFAVRVLDAVEPGADTLRLGSKVIDGALGRQPQPASADLRGARDELRQLHRRAAAGQAVAAGEWRAIRKKALAATDAAANEQDKALGSIIEAAAWDPATSPTAVSDMLRMASRYAIARTDEVLGWTAADHEAIKAKLDEIARTCLAPNPGDKRTVFQILAEIDPATDARIREYNANRNKVAAQSVADSARLLLEAMESAT